MKKNKLLVYIMAISLFLYASSVTVEAVNNRLSSEKLNTVLDIVKGDWYNNNGAKVLSIHDGYMNDCEIVEGFDWAGSRKKGGAVLRIMEGSGLRDIRINWLKGKGAGNYVQLDQGEHLHSTATDYFFESVGGIHLGMTADEVEKMYGGAQVIAERENFIDGNPNRVRWYYPNLGVVLWFDGKSVSHISLLKSSSLCFERSGLNCSNTPQEYAKAYAMERVPELPKSAKSVRAYSIGQGEFLYFGPDMNYVGLDIYGW